MVGRAGPASVCWQQTLRVGTAQSNPTAGHVGRWAMLSGPFTVWVVSGSGVLNLPKGEIMGRT